ncbi:hypothetical protein MHBO_000924 [Bonamia ostreae]|uniref:Uncharacterized protein n=1 Tax=Bonamia ostreae TaxID=126728 RepID=A0ABV2AHA9_9EUKA
MCAISKFFRKLKEEKKMFGLTIRGNKKRFDKQKQFKITSKCLEEIAQFSYSLRFDDEETKNIWQNLFTNRYEVLRQQMGVKMLVDSDQSNNSELSGKKMSGYEELEENYALLTNYSE